MYRCENCNRVVGPNIQEFKNATYRQTSYENREYTINGVKIGDRGGYGMEIANEKVVCPFCSPEVDRPKLKYLCDEKTVMLKDIVYEETEELHTK